MRALAFDLVPDELRPAVAERLVELIRKADTHLGTGFLATPYLLPVLADAGHLDVAYELLLQDTEPSWLAMVDRGATTVWERWNGVDADGVPHESLNHYSKGAVVSFLHRYTAGIELVEPAYRRFRIRPRPGGGLTRAEAAHESPYGRIESAWRIDGDAFCTCASSSRPARQAEVVLPDGTTSTAPDPASTPTLHTRGEPAMTTETTGVGRARPLPAAARADPPRRRRAALQRADLRGARRLPAPAAGRVGARRPRRRARWWCGSTAGHGWAATAATCPRRCGRTRCSTRCWTPGSPSPPSTTGTRWRPPFPAQLHDAKAAVRYLRAHADVLGVDTDPRRGRWASRPAVTSPRCSR